MAFHKFLINYPYVFSLPFLPLMILTSDVLMSKTDSLIFTVFSCGTIKWQPHRGPLSVLQAASFTCMIQKIKEWVQESFSLSMVSTATIICLSKVI